MSSTYFFIDAGDFLVKSNSTEHTLWERVIAESEHASALLQLAVTARVAQEAWRLLHERRLPLAVIAQAASDDARVFAGWAQRFNAWCDGKGWLDRTTKTGLAILKFGRQPCTP